MMQHFYAEIQLFRGQAYFNQKRGEEEEVPAGLHYICCFLIPHALMIKCPLVAKMSYFKNLCHILQTVTYALCSCNLNRFYFTI